MKEIKLTDFEKNNLSKKEMNDINGGDIWTCTCSCLYASNGGSSEMDNGCANATITEVAIQREG
jgi:natural product precursor